MRDSPSYVPTDFSNINNYTIIWCSGEYDSITTELKAYF